LFYLVIREALQVWSAFFCFRITGFQQEALKFDDLCYFWNEIGYNFFKYYQMRLILSLLFSSLLCSVVAQKDLSLEEAVMGQYQQFYPEHIFGFNWVPNTDDYSYLDKYTNLMYANAKQGNDKKILTIQEVNEKMSSEFRYFSGFEWKNSSSFYLKAKNVILLFDYKSQEGKKIELPENAENINISVGSDQVVFTIENNIHYMTMDGESKVITDFDDKNIVSGQAIARSEFGITGGLFWSPDATQIAFYQKDETYVHDYPLLNINEYPGELNAIKYPMAGQKSERAKVGIYNIKEGSIHYIEPRNGVESYLTNLSWTPESDQLVLAEVNRDQDNYSLDLYDNKANLLKTLFVETNNTWTEPERAAIFPFENTKELYWVSEMTGFDNLHKITYNDKTINIESVTENKFVLKDIVQSNDNGDVYFTSTGKSPLNTMLYKVDRKGKQTLLTKEPGTHSVKISENGDYIFDSYSSHSIPNKTVIRDAKGKVIRTLIEAENPLEEYELSEAEIKTIIGKDSTELYTRLIKPKDFDPTKKYPVLFYVYGGPHAQMITNSWLDGGSLWMHWMANQGYLVFTLDNRGSANRGVDFEHGVHRQLGKLELEDQLAGVDYLKSLEYVDHDRFAVHGWSFGGFMTGTMMTKASDVFKVGVGGGPVTDWKYYEIMYGERYMDSPQDNEEGYKNASLLENADKLEGKLLLIHGTSDNVVVMQHNLALIQKFVSIGKQVDFFPYPMHEHNVRGKDRIHLMEKVLNYILDHNE
jgi:dipeptidyl-peptidase-4